jgi:hypothetical protein
MRYRRYRPCVGEHWPVRLMGQRGARQKFQDGFSCAKVLQRTRDPEADIACSELVLGTMAEPGSYAKRWRTALRLTMSALMVAIVELTTPEAHAAAVTATLSLEHAWQTGFIAHFTVTNSSTVPLNDWKLEFDLPASESISHTWNSTLAQSGTHYVLSPANWNRTIAPGGSATGGLRGVLTGSYVPPSNCLLNRQYFCT